MADEKADVLPNGDPGKDPQSGGDADKGKGKDDSAALRAEIETLRKTNQTLSDSERYWADRAKANGNGDDEDEDDEKPAKKGKEPAPADDDDDDPAKFVDELSSKGPKAIAAYLKKKGYVTAAEASEIATKTAKQAVKAARESMTHDVELSRDYPDLQDPESELFKETSKIYKGMLKRDPKLKDSSAALLMAAENAKLKLQIEGKGKSNSEDDAEKDRQRRIREQGGDRGRRGSADFDDGDDDRMGPEAKSIAAALGVSDKDYLASKKALRGGR